MSFPLHLCFHKSNPPLQHSKQLKGMRTSMSNQGLDNETADRRDPLSHISSPLLRTTVCEVVPIININATKNDEREYVPASPSSPMITSSFPFLPSEDEAVPDLPRLPLLPKCRRSQLQENDKILYVENCDPVLLPKFPLLSSSTSNLSSPSFPKQKQTITKKVNQQARHLSHLPIPSGIRLLPKKRTEAFRNLSF